MHISSELVLSQSMQRLHSFYNVALMMTYTVLQYIAIIYYSLASCSTIRRKQQMNYCDTHARQHDG